MRRALLVAKLLIAAGLLTWLVRSGRLDLAALVAAPGRGFHLLGVLLVLASLLLQVVRWWLLLAVQGITLPFVRVLRFTWIGYFYALVLPGAGAGDVVRGVFVVREAVGARLKASTTVLVDRAVGLYAFLCIAVIAVAFEGSALADAPGMSSLRLTVLALFAACTVAAAALLLRGVRLWVRRVLPRRLRAPLADAADSYAGAPRALLYCLGLSLLASGLLLGAFFVAGRVVAVELSFPQVVLVIPLVFIVNTLPLAPGGVGVGEAAAAVLFSACGVSGGATLMLTVRLWQAATRLPGLLLHLAGGSDWRQSRNRGVSAVSETAPSKAAATSFEGEQA